MALAPASLVSGIEKMKLKYLPLALLPLAAIACGTETSEPDVAVAAAESPEDATGVRVIGTPIDPTDVAPAPPEVTEFDGTFGSVFELGAVLVDAINRNDVDTMLAHRMNEAEFYWIVWPEQPSNRPEVGMPWDFVWRDMDQKSTNSARFIANKYQGQDLRLIRVEFDGETTSYGPYKVHRDARCIVQMPDGELQTLDLFGSVIEMNGRFKAYSLLVD